MNDLIKWFLCRKLSLTIISLNFLKLFELINSEKDQFKDWLIKYIVRTTDKIMKVVCSVSVQTMVLIPPLYVYSQIKSIEKITVNSNGIWNESKTNFWSTIATKKSLKDAPIILDMKKKKAPVL